VAYVLGRFSPQEIPRMRQVLDRTVALVELALEQGLEPAMSRYNGPVADA
jgi:peptidyl-tRNA hydrolase